MSREKIKYTEFQHLGNMPPRISSIMEIDPHDIWNEHLGTLNEHLMELQEQFPWIAREIQITREKIQLAMWLNPNISLETLKVANDPNYGEKYKKVA